MNTSAQTELLVMLKSKGTGKTMGKNLSDEQLQRLPELLRSADASDVTKGTLLTALLSLPPEKNESEFITQLRQAPSDFLPDSLMFLVGDFHHLSSADREFAQLVINAINGESVPESKLQLAFETVFSPNTPPVLVASFLEALRLKEETPQENLAGYHYLQKVTKSQRIQRKVIDLSVGYDGFSRTPFLMPFTAPILAALGYGVVLHGIRDIGPKHGVNFYKILAERQYPVGQSVDAAAEKVESPEIGWAYIDETQFCPELYRLQETRNLMLKRPMLSTLEKLLIPIQSHHETLVVSSYTHPPYKSKMTQLLQSNPAITAFMLVRGVEGSIQLALDRKTPLVTLSISPEDNAFIRPEDYGFDSNNPPETPADISIIDSLQLGEAALAGTPGWAADSLIYFCSAVLTTFSGMPSEAASNLVREAIASGNANRLWENGLKS